jgi:hypothetical protein
MSRRATRQPKDLTSKDLAILRECMRFVGGGLGESFKDDLMSALSRGNDPASDRIMRTIRNLSEAQIVAWCDSD